MIYCKYHKFLSLYANFDCENIHYIKTHFLLYRSKYHMSTELLLLQDSSGKGHTIFPQLAIHIPWYFAVCIHIDTRT